MKPLGWVMLAVFLLWFGNLPLAYSEHDFTNRNRTFEPLTQIKARPDIVVLIPNAGVVFVYRDKYGQIIGEEYYSVRVQDQGIGLCDDVGQGDIWLFTGGGILIHKEEEFPIGIQPYWRYLDKDQSFLHNEESTKPKK